jgi:hypothetical protein
MSLRHIAEQRPVFAAVFCAGLQFLLTILILKAGMAFAPPEAFGKVKLLAFASTVILPLLLAQAFGLWRRVGFDAGKVRPAPLFMVSLLSAALFLSMGVHPQEHGLNLCMIYSNIAIAAGPTALFVVQRLANAFELALAAYVVMKAAQADRSQHGFRPAPEVVAAQRQRRF